MYIAFREGYLCLLKRFLFLSIHRLYFISFYVKYIERKGYKNFLGTCFWAPILFKGYQNTSGCDTDFGTEEDTFR